MRTTRFRHVLAVVTAAAVLASLTAATVASPASAAKPRCGGFAATIVGTARGERIVGTNRRDVIVARGGRDVIYGRGGNDIICAGNGNDRVIAGPGNDRVFGQRGRDRLNGGPGDDVLLGMVGNDTLNGALGTDTCLQGTGAGPILNCELPAPPPPPPPILEVAYADANQNDLYDAGDVMIAEIVDTNRDGIVSNDDTINMGQYPTRLDAVQPARIRQTYEPWTVKTHTVSGGDQLAAPDAVQVSDGTYLHVWVRGATFKAYVEEGPGANTSTIADYLTAGNDVITLNPSVSQPMDAPLALSTPYNNGGDFIDVWFAPGV